MKKISGLALGIFLAICFVIMFFLIPIGIEDTTEGVLGARFVPTLLFGLGAFISAVFAFVFKNERYEVDMKIYPMVIGLFVYYFLVVYFGFIIATVVTMIGFVYIWKIKSKIAWVAISVGTPLVIYIAFVQLLQIALPMGLLFE